MLGGTTKLHDQINSLTFESERSELTAENQITLLRVIPTMTFQNSLLTPLLSEAFVTGLLPN